MSLSDKIDVLLWQIHTEVPAGPKWLGPPKSVSILSFLSREVNRVKKLCIA